MFNNKNNIITRTLFQFTYDKNGKKEKYVEKIFNMYPLNTFNYYTLLLPKKRRRTLGIPF